MNGLTHVLRTNGLLQLGYAVLVVALLVVGRAFATDNVDLPLRIVMWSIVVGLVTMQARLIFTLINPIPRLPGSREFIALIVTAFLTAGELALLKYTPLLPKEHDPYFEFVLFLIAPVFILGSGALLIDKFANIQAKPAEKIAQNNRSSDILTVQAQEHYLLMTTVSGTKIQRGRFRDQLAALKGFDGIQVHRSWWVARAAVSQVLKLERDYVVQLVSGETVPVARSKVVLLREAGWI